jgi:hypothetical protein
MTPTTGFRSPLDNPPSGSPRRLKMSKKYQSAAQAVVAGGLIDA